MTAADDQRAPSAPPVDFEAMARVYERTIAYLYALLREHVAILVIEGMTVANRADLEAVFAAVRTIFTKHPGADRDRLRAALDPAFLEGAVIAANKRIGTKPYGELLHDTIIEALSDPTPEKP